MFDPNTPYTILSINEGASFDRLGGTTKTRVVTYLIFGEGPFTKTIPAATFDPNILTKNLDEEAEGFKVLHRFFPPPPHGPTGAR